MSLLKILILLIAFLPFLSNLQVFPKPEQVLWY
jgi:hypothetical protein